MSSTGRDDSYLNAVCNSLLNRKNYPKNVNEWKELLSFGLAIIEHL